MTYLRPTFFLLIVTLLCSLSAIAQAHSDVPPEKALAPSPRNPATVIVWPQQFTVVHNPPSQTTFDLMYIENVSFQPRTFEIYEGENNCTPSGDVPWISAEPTSGDLPLKGAIEISPTFSSVGLANGTYTGEVCVLTNDPQTPRTDVSLTLQVGPQPTATATPQPPTSTPTRTKTPLPPTSTPTRTQTPPPNATLTPTRTKTPLPPTSTHTRTPSPGTTLTPTQLPSVTPTLTQTPPPGATLTPTAANYSIYLPLARRR